MPITLNVADRLAEQAARNPEALAVVCPRKFSPRQPSQLLAQSGTEYSTITFGKMNQHADEIAKGLVATGAKPGIRLALLVSAGIEFVTLVFALLRTGVTTILIDPGLGAKQLLSCLQSVEPDGFVAISKAQAIRAVLSHKFPRAKLNVTVGRRWFWGGQTLDQIQRTGQATDIELPSTTASSEAAIIFTSGSTGPAKGVLYTQQMFDTQVSEIATRYSLAPGAVDMSCFPLFGLFNSAMGVTTVFPDMDFSRPATAEPEKLLAAARDWQVTQSFASPAVWDRLSNHLLEKNERIETLQNIFSCGAPVPAKLLQRTLKVVHPAAAMHTPYGATECLPVSTIEAAEVLNETAEQTDGGAGICVGAKFDAAEWKVIRITDEPIANIEEAEELSRSEIGELVVSGPQASQRYVTSESANAASKIADGNSFWHRMGDVGYFDDQGRFWYCGRKAHRVELADRTLFTIPVEAVFNTHPAVRRSALVGIRLHSGVEPTVIYETTDGKASSKIENDLKDIAQSLSHTQAIARFLHHPGLPVDIRHNAKINREQLATWATRTFSDRE